MMSGMAVIWLIIVIMIAVRAKGPRLAGRGGSNELPPERQQTPDELARDRYARGEIGWPEYQEVLVNLLKDRYVRGELELSEYEERASRALDWGRADPRAASAQLQAPSAGQEPRPRSPEDSLGSELGTDEPDQSVGSTPEASALERSAIPMDTAEDAHDREARTDTPLETLRRRFLSGELSDQEYEEQLKVLMAA